MRRVEHPPRLDWVDKVEALGLVFHTTPDGQPYWKESASYEIDARDVAMLENATNTLAQMCLKAVDFIIEKNLFGQLGLGPLEEGAIRYAWEQDPASIYGRFDLAYDGHSVKLLEYNADTPTALLEAAVVQWHWLQEVAPGSDQFNSIWEALVAKWKALAAEDGALKGRPVYFACADAVEDVMTITTLRDTAEEAGVPTQMITMADIGWDAGKRQFVDMEDQPILSIFKLYPWEWMVKEEFGANALRQMGTMDWIEPVWKMLLSTKGLLPILWQMYPNHEYLLPAYFGNQNDLTDYVRKPLLGREGANIQVVRGGRVVHETDGEYGDGRFVYQGYFDTPAYDGFRPVIGSWVVDHTSCGLGFRESSTLVTDNLSAFVPHRIV